MMRADWFVFLLREVKASLHHHTLCQGLSFRKMALKVEVGKKRATKHTKNLMKVTRKLFKPCISQGDMKTDVYDTMY